ncbi:MAG: transglycosylase SLT domain-containing protein [Roseovarius sp.]|nr:transglycosylase SLT domain-containing protein [Roseovarius sp.]
MRHLAACFLMILLPCTALGQDLDAVDTAVEDAAQLPNFPPARDANLPRTRWERVPGGTLWTRSALSSLKAHASVLPEMVPADIADWCPAYPAANMEKRRAFWVGFMSTLVKHESTYKPAAVGGGGRWYGLTQILPSTARGYKCRARSGAALKHGPENLSCALRIMAFTVPRDGVVSRGMRGVAADWGPLHSRKKRHDMMAWTNRQSYCKPLSKVRPQARPTRIETAFAE